METKREMSKYKMNGRTASKLNEYWYKVIDGNGLNLYDIPASYIEDEGFGWEKVEEFQPNEWLYYETGNFEWIVRFSEQKGNLIFTKEAYEITEGKFKAFRGNDKFSMDYSKATPDQVERILSIVARHKGYKKGVAVISALSGEAVRLLKGRDIYEPDADIFLTLGYCVYSKGIWAQIVEEKVTEPQVEGKEYLCIQDSTHFKGSHFTKGKRYLFQKEQESFRTINDEGGAHELNERAMHLYFDMGQDWKTAKVFSYEDIEGIAFLKNHANMVLLTYDLEEEAKKRTQL
jgi:hypothetical protein